MDDEDNAIGLSVKSLIGRTWHTFGDKCLLDKEDVSDKNEAWNAVRTSADEIYNAWKTKTVPQYPQYAVWNYAPILSEVQSMVAPLFRPTASAAPILGSAARPSTRTTTGTSQPP